MKIIDSLRRPKVTIAPDETIHAAADADLHEVFALFRTNAVRRVAVVRGEQFVGMMTVDDLLIGMAGELTDLARPVMAEVLFGGHHDAPVPATV